MRTRYSQHSMYACVAITTLIVAIILLRQYLIGGMPFTPTGEMSDLIRANLPAYTLYYDMLTENMHFWSWTMAIGTSVFSHADIFFDPFTYVCFIGGRENIAYMMGWSFAIKVVLESVSIALYLNHFKLDKKAICIASIMYAFCGYSIIMGSNLALGTILVYAPLALLFIEKSFTQKKYWIPFTIIITLIGLCSYYYLYTFGIISLIYIIIRSKMLNISIKKNILLLFVCGITTILLIMPILLPQAELMLESARASSGKDIVLSLNLLIPDIGTLFTIICRSFSISDLGMFETYVGTAYNGGHDFFQAECYISCISFTLCGLYIYKNKQVRKTSLSIILLIIVLCAIPIFSYIMNATITINYRWLFIIHILFCLLTAFSIDFILKKKFTIKEISIVCFFSIFVLLLSVVIIAHINNTSAANIISENAFVYVTIVGSILLLCIFLTIHKKITIKSISSDTILVIAISAIIIFSTITFYSPWYDHETCSFEDSKYGYDDPSSEVIENIMKTDSSFYRIYKDFDSVYNDIGIPSNNDAMVQKYYGLKNYNSNCNSNYIEFLQTMGVYVACCPNIEDLKKQGIEPKDLTGPTLNYINGVDDKYNLYDYLDVKYYLSKSNSGNSIPNQFIYQYTEQGIDVYKNTQEYSLAFVNSKYITYDDFMSLSYDERNEIIMDHTIIDSPKNIIDSTDSSSICTTTYFSEDNIKFDVTIVGGPQYVSFSIPYDKCWKIYVDDNEVKSEKINISLLGVLLEEGTHNVELKYVPSSFFNGIAISAISLAIIATILVGYKIIAKNHTKAKNEHQ